MNIEIKGEEVFVDGERYVREPKSAISETDKGRLCKYIHKATGEYFYGEYQRDTDENVEKNIGFTARPVHRRWDELSLTEKSDFTRNIYNSDSGQEKFYEAYRLITGEDHS
jgi:hypothetical protein